MDKKLLIQLGIELGGTLIRSGLALARTLGVDNDQLDEAYKAAKASFEENDPSNIKFD